MLSVLWCGTQVFDDVQNAAKGLLTLEGIADKRSALLVHSRMHRGVPRRGFIPAETLVQNDTAGGNGTAGGT